MWTCQPLGLHFVNNIVDAGAVLNRLSEILDCKNDSELAKKLDVGRTTVSAWRTRGSVPYAECVDVALREGVFLDYIITGRKQASLDSGVGEERQKYSVIDEKVIREVTARVFAILTKRKIQPTDPLKIGPIRDFACLVRLTDDQIELLFDMVEQLPDIYDRKT
ncbi:MAG: hypothetical protein COA54_02385 [Thiotrichaceae bacterium]|nr:MAG: hypothetical protein COA54_02385 [Thiotrichaceae bacterium]